LRKRFFHPFPKYLQIRQILLRRLSRDLAPGDRFPTEHKLMEEFGVSRETVREALRGLEDQGLISRRRGQGTHVVRRVAELPDRRLTGLIEDYTELKLDTETRLLEHRAIPPPPELTAVTGFPTFGRIYQLRQLRLLDGQPLAHHESFLPVDLGCAVVTHDLRRTTVLHVLKYGLGQQIWEDRHEIDATVADTELAGVLDVPLGAPLLVIRRLYVTPEGRCAVYFRTQFRSDRYYYSVQLAMPETRRAPGETMSGKPRSADVP
jgi:GntR family transcriptional regulator